MIEARGHRIDRVVAARRAVLVPARRVFQDSQQIVVQFELLQIGFLFSLAHVCRDTWQTAAQETSKPNDSRTNKRALLTRGERRW